MVEKLGELKKLTTSTSPLALDQFYNKVVVGPKDDATPKLSFGTLKTSTVIPQRSIRYVVSRAVLIADICILFSVFAYSCE